MLQCAHAELPCRLFAACLKLHSLLRPWPCALRSTQAGTTITRPGRVLGIAASPSLSAALLLVSQGSGPS